jgi:hypothetical protein
MIFVFLIEFCLPLQRKIDKEYDTECKEVYCEVGKYNPENTQNTRYTFDQLKESIELMRAFIQSKND